MIESVLNSQRLWKIPTPTAKSNKYTRGHAVVIGGGRWSTGASRLAAYAALRAGAGLVSIACDELSLPIYASSMMAVMTKQANHVQELAGLLEDQHITALCIGPGFGVTSHAEALLTCALDSKKPCVIDADALTLIAKNARSLLPKLHENCVLTPHAGEFARVTHAKAGLKDLKQFARDNKVTILLKGSDTYIANTKGKLVVNKKAPAWLATAGSGDVLAGIITGLLAQGMPSFDAACAGVWLHSKAAQKSGKGMIAEDLLTRLY